MSGSDQHWRKIQKHLTEWATELDKAKADAETEVAKVQSQYYERLTDLRSEIERNLKRWGAELRELTQKAGTTEAAGARGLEEFRARVQAEITEWQPEIEQLKARATQAKSDAKRLAQQLKAKGEEASDRLKALKRTAGKSWDEIRPVLERAWAELRPALQSAAAKFREPRPPVT